MKPHRLTLGILAALAISGALTFSFAAPDSAAGGNTSTVVSSAAKTPPIGYVFEQAPIDRSNRNRLTSYADMLDKVTPAVVSVYTTSRVTEQANPNRQRGGFPNPGQYSRPIEEGVGSGSIITSDGYILTNHHVVTMGDENNSRPADSILVKLADGREFDAQLVGSDKATDIALLKIDAKNLPTLRMADSDKLRVGDVVFAVGNPMDVGLTVTQGIISATSRSHLDLIDEGFEDFIQTDASINPGNSGGPLVDADGRLIGLNSAILSTSYRPSNMGIGFAVPASLAKHVVDGLIKDGRVKRGLIGAGLQTLDHNLAQGFGVTNSHGALVSNIFPGAPGERGGLLRGDIVVKLNDEEVDTSGKLRYLVSMTDPGQTVNLAVIRDGQPRNLKVTVADRDQFLSGMIDVPATPQQDAQPAFVRGQRWGVPDNVPTVAGVGVLPLDSDIRQAYGVPSNIEGLGVVGLTFDSPFANDLPRQGAVIMEVNKHPVKNVDDFVAQLTPGKVNLLWVYYGGQYRYIAAAMPGKN